jgi:hypothetical protein
MAAAEEAAAKAQTEPIPRRPPPRVKPKGPKPRPSSGYYGVSADRKRWKAQIGHGGKKHNLGRFDTKQEAALAYDTTGRQGSAGRTSC